MKFKKILTTLLTSLLLVSNLTFVQALDTKENAELKDFKEIVKDENVADFLADNDNLFINFSEYKEAKEMIKNNKKDSKKFLKNNNIIVLFKYDESDSDLAEALGFPIVATEDIVQENNLESETTTNDIINEEGKTVGTLYYLDEYNKPVIHDIVVSKKLGEKESKQKVIKIFNEVKKDLEKIKSSEEEFSTKAVEYETDYIGRYKNSASYSDKATIEVNYRFYTLQDYDGSDYYTLIATINANPGKALYDLGDTDYDEKWQGENLDVTFQSKTDGFTREEYGPERTVDSKSYGINLGAGWSKNGVDVSSSFSGTWYISDTDIDVNSSSTKTEWELTLDRGAQKQTCTFHPGITYEIDEDKKVATMYTKTKFYVDAWDESKRSYSISRYVFVTPDAIGDY